MAELSQDEKTLLQQVFKAAIRPRLIAGDLAAATSLKKLELKILYPPTEVDWAATAAGRRITARDRRAG